MGCFLGDGFAVIGWVFLGGAWVLKIFVGWYNIHFWAGGRFWAGVLFLDVVGMVGFLGFCWLVGGVLVFVGVSDSGFGCLWFGFGLVEVVWCLGLVGYFAGVLWWHGTGFLE